MCAYIRQIERGFFEELRPPSNAVANFRDPPLPRNAKEPEPWQ